MIKDKIIIIPFHLPWNWTADFERQTALTLSQNNFVVAVDTHTPLTLKKILKIKKYHFIEKKQKNLYFVKPLCLLPFSKFKFIFKMNLSLFFLFLNLFLIFRRNQGKILWLFYPRLIFLKYLFPNYLSVYDCVDFFTSEDKQEFQKIKDDEKKTVKTVDFVFANSKVLQKDKKKYRQNINLVPQGFSLDVFKSTQKLPKNSSIFKLKKPIIGYIGGINHRLDYPLLIKLARKNPKLTFLLVGPLQKDHLIGFKKQLKELKRIKNISFLENQPRELLTQIINSFDVCLIPYDIKQDFNKFCHPMKIFEYFYLKKPVVSTPIEELKRFQPYVKIADNADKFSKEIKKILKDGWSKEYAQKQRELAIDNSWENKIKEISLVLEKKTKKNV